MCVQALAWSQAAEALQGKTGSLRPKGAFKGNIPYIICLYFSLSFAHWPGAADRCCCTGGREGWVQTKCERSGLIPPTQPVPSVGGVENWDVSSTQSGESGGTSPALCPKLTGWLKTEGSSVSRTGAGERIVLIWPQQPHTVL